jgi:PAS domain S-box-containing protein
MDDIIAHERAEAATQRQSEMLSVSFDAMFVWRLGGGIESWNRAAEQLYGYSEGEAIGEVSHKLLKATYPEPWPEIEAKLRKSGSWEGELRHITKEGREVTVATRHQLIVDAAGAERVLETNREIGERKRAEVVLQSAQTKLQGIISSAIDAMISVDEQQRIVMFNPAAESVFQCAAAEAIGSTLNRFIPKSLREIHYEHVQRLEGATAPSMRAPDLLTAVRFNGERFPIEATVSQLQTDGETMYTAILREVFESKRAMALRESAERLRAASSDVMFRMNPDWSEMRRLSGGEFITDTETTSRTWLQEYIHPDDRSQVMAVVNEAIRTQTIFEMEHRFLLGEGGFGWTFSRAVPLLDANGEIVEWVGAASDITERKLAEEALFKAGALQRAIFNSANFSSIATDANGIIQIFNIGAERMMGYTAAEVVNRLTPADISDPQEVIARAKALSLELGIPIKPGFEALVFKASRGIEDIYELTYVRKDGSRFPAMVSVTALRDAQHAIIGYLLIGTDNSARKLAEEALFRAGALQRAIFNSANFSSIATDAGGVIQIFNVGAERMLGYKATDVKNKITPADISDPQEVIARAKALSLELGTTIKPGFEALVFKASRGIEDIYELTYVRKDGSRFPAMVSVTALRDPRSAIIGYLLIGTDNTARKQAEEALFKAGALQRAIFDSANFSSIATDANGIIQIFNVGAERMLGYSAAEVMNKITPADISDPQEVVARAQALSHELGTPIEPGFEALVFKASRGIEDIYELTYLRKDGSRFPAMVSVTALRDAQETILGYLLIGTDNSARKLAEEALYRAGALQRAIFDSANFSSIATDANGIIQIFNVGAERMMGYTAAEVVNKITPADISDSQEVIERAKALSRELRTEIKPGFEALVFKASRGIEDIYALTYVRKDGSRFPAMVSVTALRDAQEAILGYLLIGTDNTARKQAEEALIRSEKLASVGRLAATIAHEINNPLSAALNALYLVRTDPALPECVRDHIVLAEQELGRVAHITKQALGFFREVGHPTALDVGEVFDSVLDIYEPRLRNKDIEVKRRYRSGTRIHAIDEEIRQVSSNIIANSLDALSQGGKLHVRLFGPQALRGHRRMVRITVADDGEGIAAENLKQICEPFFTTKQSVGTGLGLWVTSELVKKLEGRIRFRSHLGKGTVVTIWLPMERRGLERRSP